VLAVHQFVGVARRHPHQQTALAADRDGHVAVDQKRQPAEHPFLFEAALPAQEFADAVGEVFVVRHAPILPLRPSVRVSARHADEKRSNAHARGR
jgi:hypothetical protein